MDRGEEDLSNPIRPYLAPLQLRQPSHDIGSVCEIRHYERLKNAKGETLLLRAGSNRARSLQTPRDDWSSHAALIQIKEPKPRDDKDPEITLEIQSPHMKLAMKTCIPQFQSIDIDQKSIVLQGEPQCIFHYRHELIDYHQKCAENNDKDAADHVRFLLDHMFKQLASEVLHFHQHMENPVLQPALGYFNLWMAFTPGDLIYVGSGCAGSASSEPADYLFKLQSMTRCRCPKTWCPNYSWELTGYHIDYNGEDFGHVYHYTKIQPYEGLKALQDLTVIPLKFHPDNAVLKEKFITRGKTFVGLSGEHFKHCKGVARLLKGTRTKTFLGEDDYFDTRLTHINSRVFIDGKTFSEARPTHQPTIVSSEKSFRTELRQHLEMKDEEYMICDDKVAGYSLQHHKWGWFGVNTIQEVEFDDDAFSCLIIQPKFKDMMLSLVKSHTAETNDFDDFIKGKGKGLIFLLHGDPGTGKTLTAESIADYVRRPLIRMDMSALGSSPGEIEESLTATFEVARKWNAITLLDEADVFLEQRRNSDLQRNHLVGTFLRSLEYFEGVMFLTTNRIQSFDRAFKSRIHLAIYYPKLDKSSRKEIWELFLERPGLEIEADVRDSGFIETMAGQNLNGRQIKNAVSLARSFAVSQGRSLGQQHLETAFAAMTSFETDFIRDQPEEDNDSVNNNRKRQRT
ncbi:P-loop containing nucleoside triphosphate hydrolase protein [Thelonectria olida]|uniref:P-loop containing nucleoside triphosphate hydrolase protein n=1 Tax=Thelonectria olida TaxID=1576542 RepID=A0A9P8VWK3_9HYPO|nr:P-loop containing nucleoside triphosphate hydrolase protein [Thelonectria olida]